VGPDSAAGRGLDPQEAADRFIEVHAAYQELLLAAAAI